MRPSTYPSIHPSVHLLIHPFTHPSIHLSIHSPTYPSIHLSIHPSTYRPPNLPSMTLPNNKHPHLHSPLRPRSRIPIPGNSIQNLLNQIGRHNLGLSGQALGLAKQLGDGGADPGLLLLDPPVARPDVPLQGDLLPGGLDEGETSGAAVEPLQGGRRVAEAVAELVEARVQQAELGEVLHGGHVAERGAQVG